MKFIDLTGKRYGRLVVLKRIGTKCGHPLWKCVCDCGETHEALASTLKAGATQSCGCLRRELVIVKNTTHGLSNSPEYIIWGHIKARCLNKNSQAFKYYGGRGISICPKWEHSFKAFLDDMGERPTVKHSIERVNNDGDYEPSNCQWIPIAEQAWNTRSIKPFYARDPIGRWYFGKVQSLFAREHGLHYSCISEVLNGNREHTMGWSFFRRRG